jgi:hypothetical protein
MSPVPTFPSLAGRSPHVLRTPGRKGFPRGIAIFPLNDGGNGDGRRFGRLPSSMPVRRSIGQTWRPSTGHGWTESNLEPWPARSLSVAGPPPDAPRTCDELKRSLSGGLHFDSERWLSGLTRRLAKPLRRFTASVGSNPTLSARGPGPSGSGPNVAMARNERLRKTWKWRAQDIEPTTTWK